MIILFDFEFQKHARFSLIGDAWAHEFQFDRFALRANQRPLFVYWREFFAGPKFMACQKPRRL
jgi:hypothetical protein